MNERYRELSTNMSFDDNYFYLKRFESRDQVNSSKRDKIYYFCRELQLEDQICGSWFFPCSFRSYEKSRLVCPKQDWPSWRENDKIPMEIYFVMGFIYDHIYTKKLSAIYSR